MADNKRTCSIPECGKPHKGLGYCNKHYLRFKTHGRPENAWPTTEEERFWAKVDRRGENECWMWAKPSSNRGYGSFHSSGKQIYAHRYSYQLHFGSIPERILIDHRCQNSSCVNPRHLRLATNKQNVEYRKGLASNNTSGYRNVYWDGKQKRWVVSLVHHGATVYVGQFADIERANAAAKAKRSELFTFPETE